jgi:uncharacterized membrane protein
MPDTLETLPQIWQPWFALALLAVLGFAATRCDLASPPVLPLVGAAALVLLINYSRVVFDVDTGRLYGEEILRVLYAVALYTAYALTRRVEGLMHYRQVLLYAGHLAAMVAAAKLLDSDVAVSVSWSLLAVASLAIAMWLKNHDLGRSSFLVFIATSIKVLLFDLSGSPALARIVVLLVLGISLYTGGWLYQRLVQATRETGDGTV